MFYDTEFIKEESIEHKIGTSKLFKKFTKSSFFKIATKPVTHKASKVANSDSFRWAYKRFIENNPEVHLKIMRLTKPNATIDDPDLVDRDDELPATVEPPGYEPPDNREDVP